MSNQAQLILTGKNSDFLKIGVAAAARGNLPLVNEIARVKPRWLSRVGPHGRTMLWEAAHHGRLDVVRFLVANGADINQWGCHFTPLLVCLSPLAIARLKKRVDVADYLEAVGAKADPYSATYLGHAETLRKSLDIDAALLNRTITNTDCAHPVSLLHYGIAGRQVELVLELLDRGANPQPHCESLLKFAIWRSQPQVLEALLLAGCTFSSKSVPHVGIRNEELNGVLDRFGVKVNVDASDHGWPPLVYESRGDRGGNLDRITALLEQGADVNITNYKGQTALHCAAKAGFVDVVALLIKNGAEIERKDDSGETALSTAIRSTIKAKDKIRVVCQQLLDAGADLDTKVRTGTTPRQLIVRKRYIHLHEFIA